MEHGSGNSGRKPSWLTGRGILIAVIFLLGLGIFLYPHICDWYYQYQFNKAIAAYDRFQGIDCEGMIQAAREYNERLAKKEEQFLVPAEEREELDHLLDPWGTGMMGYVDIPKIGVHIPIYHGTEERALQSGAGFWYGTSLPVGGENTHCVLFAVFIVAHVRVAGHHAPRAVGGNPCVGIYVPRGRFGNVGLTRNKE